ncbi:MAG: exodeoxyribonuclease III, partial [bacterium]
GIRASAKKGFFEWMQQEQPDIVCIQETKAQVHQLEDPIFHPQGYHCFYHDAQKKGYSGVAIYAKQKPDQVVVGMGWDDVDNEGRVLRADFGQLSVISLYLPSGSSKDERQDFKYRVMDQILPFFENLKAEGRELIICGDWNIVHKEIDIKNWKANQKRSGCLPEERAWLDKVFGKSGFVDGFRAIKPDEVCYTWWSNRGRAWDNNVGWRIDYQVVTPNVGKTIKDARVFRDIKLSDHAPLILDYDWV